MARIAFFLAALGPGVIGMTADNDAGGMLSYLVTGASHGLRWLLPALILLGVPSLFVMWLACRVSQVTHLPYSKVLIGAVGRPVAAAEAVAIFALNVLILVTEFVGMTLALGLAGIPIAVSLPLTFVLVVALTGSHLYARIEELLLRTSVVSLAFIPALLLLHPAPGAFTRAFSAHVANPWFLLLALAGNAIAPWMIYWQQNAAWAGVERTPGQQFWDIATGVISLVIKAGVVLLLGALITGGPSSASDPLRWVYTSGGHLVGMLFALGIFDAGLVAACTISLSSLWTLREAFGAGAEHPSDSPTRGPWLGVHLGTLALSAAFVLLPHLSAGSVALWANALPGVWMPVSLILLGIVVSSRRIMGARVIRPATKVALGAVIAVFLAASVLGLAL